MLPHLSGLREALRTAIKSRVIRHRYNRRLDDLGNANGAFAPGESAEDGALVDCLVASFKSWAERPTGQWADIYPERHADIGQAIGANDRAGIERVLRDPVTSDIFFGFDSTV